VTVGLTAAATRTVRADTTEPVTVTLTATAVSSGDILRNITVTAALAPRRWVAHLDARTKYGTLNNRRWEGGLE